MASYQIFRLVPVHDKVGSDDLQAPSRLHSGLTMPSPLQVPDENDEWAGLGDVKERRKRQNRINQRAARKIDICHRH